MRFINRFFVSGNEIIDCNMNNIPINRADKIIIFLYRKTVSSYHFLIYFLILFFKRVWLPFQNWLHSFRLNGFFFSWLFKSCHSSWHLCCWCVNMLFTSNYCHLTPLYSFLLCFWLLFLWYFDNFRVKVSIFQNYFILVFTIIPISW